MPRSLPALVLALVVALAIVLAACDSESSGGATTIEAVSQRGPFAVGVTTRTMVDDSRPTRANGDFQGAPDRTMAVEIWYPAIGDAEDERRDVELDASAAPYPLIVFSHGLSSSRRQSASYTQHLASHGYLVIAPDYPLSNAGAPGGPTFVDVPNQAGDVSFAIDTILAYSADTADSFSGAVDSEAIGVTGHSLGGLTSVLAVFGDTQDPRIDAALPFATPGCFLTGSLETIGAPPMLVVGGTRDLLTPPASARRPFDLTVPPRYYVELIGASHVRFSDFDIADEAVLGPLAAILGDEGAGRGLDGEIGDCLAAEASADDPHLTLARQGELLRTFATPFFDAYLRGSDDARAFLQDELPGLVPEARVEMDLG